MKHDKDDIELLTLQDGGSSRVASWWIPIPDVMLTTPGCTWVIYFRGDRRCFAGIVDDYGTLTPVPYNHDSFNQPEH